MHQKTRTKRHLRQLGRGILTIKGRLAESLKRTCQQKNASTGARYWRNIGGGVACVCIKLRLHIFVFFFLCANSSATMACNKKANLREQAESAFMQYPILRVADIIIPNKSRNSLCKDASLAESLVRRFLYKAPRVCKRWFPDGGSSFFTSN